MCSTFLPLSTTIVFILFSHNSLAAQPPLIPLPITIASKLLTSAPLVFTLTCKLSPIIKRFYFYSFPYYLCSIYRGRKKRKQIPVIQIKMDADHRTRSFHDQQKKKYRALLRLIHKQPVL